MSDAVLTSAMEIALTWGPDRLIAEDVRLRKIHPNVSDEEAQTARSIAYRVIYEASESIAEGTKSGKLTYPEARRRLMTNRPWLTEELATKAISQGEYYHWRETGQ